MKNIKYKIILSVVFSLAILSSFASIYLDNKNNKESNYPDVQKQSTSIENDKKISQYKNIEKIKAAPSEDKYNPDANTTIQVDESLENKIAISFVIGDKKYDLNIKEGSNAFEAMDELAKLNNEFSFTSKEYIGLGRFVDSINGLPGSSGKYWIYYINNKEASVGVSSYVLKSGDVIEWKQK